MTHFFFSFFREVSPTTGKKLRSRLQSQKCRVGLIYGMGVMLRPKLLMPIVSAAKDLCLESPVSNEGVTIRVVDDHKHLGIVFPVIFAGATPQPCDQEGKAARWTSSTCVPNYLLQLQRHCTFKLLFRRLPGAGVF